MRFEAVICAAGGGTRMGKNKALCQLSSDETFLSSIVSSIRSISHDAPIAVVIGAQAEEVKSIHRSLCDDPNLFWVENLSWQSTHMLDSFMLGLYALPRHCIALHWPVDCIGIAPADIARLIEAPDAPFAVLSFQGTPGHPLRISANKADWMRDNAASFQSLKQIIHDDKRIFVESNTFAIVNCNDPNRLAQIQQLRDKTPTTS